MPEASGERVLFETNRLNGDLLRATYSSFRGKDYAGVRVYYRDKAGDPQPGKNGCTVLVEELPGLAQAAVMLLYDTTQNPSVKVAAAQLLTALAGGNG